MPGSTRSGRSPASERAPTHDRRHAAARPERRPARRRPHRLRSRRRCPTFTRASMRSRRPTSIGSRMARLSRHSSIATSGTCRGRSTSRRCDAGRRRSSAAMTSLRFSRRAATCTPRSARYCRSPWGQTGGQTRVRPESDRGQTPIVIRVTGDGFLRHMVRTIAGTLVDVGLGRWPASHVAGIVAGRDRSRAGRAAPASGLFLVRVDLSHECSHAPGAIFAL